MSKTSDTVIERAKVREAAGVFHSRRALDAAIDALLLAGFDRADLDVVAPPDRVRERLGPVEVAAEELADVPQAPRQPIIKQDDIANTKVVWISTIAGFVALIAAFVVLAMDGSVIRTIVVALVCGAIGGGSTALVIDRLLRTDELEAVAPLMEARGIVLWVRVHSPEQEDKAQEILRSHGGKAVRVHEINLAKYRDDIPLSSLRPDPWLGDERLGQP
jgi:hypothetical protein